MTGLPFAASVLRRARSSVGARDFGAARSIRFRGGAAPLRGLRLADRKFILAPLSEYYDLEADPGETRDRWDDPACADVRAELQERVLRGWDPDDIG